MFITYMGLRLAMFGIYCATFAVLGVVDSIIDKH